MPQKNLLKLHEAIVVVLINKPSRTARLWEIAKLIEERNLYPVRKGNISLEKQVMLRATKSKGAYKHLFQDIGSDYIRLQDMEIDFPLRLWNALESLLEHDRKFYYPDLKTLSVVRIHNDIKESIKLETNPANIVCIESVEKSRKKKIYTLEKDKAGNELVSSYLFNNNEYNFETLCEYLDPHHHHLLVVSKNAIVNVAFYDLVEKKLLHFNRSGKKLNPPATIKISARKENDSMLRNFKLMQEIYKSRILLQKAAIGYKTDMKL